VLKCTTGPTPKNRVLVTRSSHPPQSTLLVAVMVDGKNVDVGPTVKSGKTATVVGQVPWEMGRGRMPTGEARL
jgi:hypothetical protein